MATEKVLGIDLGTTNSTMSIMEGGDPEIIENYEGDRVTPSVVAFTEEGERLIGKTAKNQAIKNPERTVQSIKRHMGEEDYTVKVDNETYSPEQISSMILQKLKKDAEEYLGEEINKAVITVPAYFSDSQRQATKDAGEIAGFEVERVINEPTAAAMSYGLDENEDKNILVYDLGGGTFDVSILELGEGVYEVISTDGDNDLGGDDWDNQLIKYIADDFKEEHGIDLTEDRVTLQRLKENAEEAKKELSSMKKTTISIPFIAEKDGESLNLEKSITRAEFEDLTRDLLERTREPVQSAISEAGLTEDDIDEVILIGGSTRMPQVKKLIEEEIGIEPKRDIDPDEAVSLGASVQGGVMSGEVDDLVLLDVNPLSLGVETKGGVFTRVIDKNTTIPTTQSKEFTTAKDNQENVHIKVYQGEREVASENKLLDEFKLGNIPQAPAGVPVIKVEFEINENGIVNVKAEETETGNTKTVTVEGGTGLSDEEIENLKQEAEKMAEEDQQKRELIEVKNQAESTIKKAERLINENNLPSEDEETLNENINKLEENMESENKEKIKNLKDKLDSKITKIGKENY